MRKFKLLSFVALLFAVFAFSRVTNVYGWGAATGDGSDYRQLQETAIFFNNSGGTRVAGEVALLDVDHVGVATGSTLGSYITVEYKNSDTHYEADSLLAVGVIKSISTVDQRPIAVVTKGPALTLCDDSTDAVTEFASVGSSPDTANCGGGTNLGIALEAGDGTDDDEIIVWVDPAGSGD
jgi:hypothetical protein